MRALILAGGRGARLEGTTEDLNKCMLFIGKRHLIEYSLECAVNPEISEIVLVVGYKREDIMNTYKDEYKQKPIKYVVQHEQKGLVHAIECAKELVRGDDFMLMLGDELLVNPRHSEMIKKFKGENIFGICGVVEVKERNLIKKTYSVVEDNQNRISQLREKPSVPHNNIMGTGNGIFKDKIFDYIGTTPINPNRNQKELPDLIQCAIKSGNIVKTFRICGNYVNVNLPDEIKEAESYFSHI